MEKTLGGDRLGSGKKMKVHLHGYERSTHDLSYLWRSTMSPGTLVPFMAELALPGDTFDINLDAHANTHPTIGPLFGSFKVQLDVFSTPVRLYQGKLHNNKLGIGMNMSQIKLPIIELPALSIPDNVNDINVCQINPSCLLAYLGIRGVGNPQGVDQTREFQAIKILNYWEIYKNYYANKQEEIGAVIHASSIFTQTVTELDVKTGGVTGLVEKLPTAGTARTLIDGSEILITFTGATPLLTNIMLYVTYGSGATGVFTVQDLALGTPYVVSSVLHVPFDENAQGPLSVTNWDYRLPTDPTEVVPQVDTFPLENIDTMRERILGHSQNSGVFTLSTGGHLEPYKWLYLSEVVGLKDYPYMMNTQEGLAIKTYQSDMFNNWLSTEWIDGAGGISELTAIDTTGGSITIDTMILARKVYNMLNRIAVSGGSYDDWLDAVYAHPRFTRTESPVYMGGLIKELIFQEVISNATSGENPLGTLGGRGILGKKHKGGYIHINVDEPSYIMGIVSLTPRIDYSQGNKWDVHLKTMDDLHKPALDEIGFQELITEQMAWWNTRHNNVGPLEWEQQSAGKQPAWLNYMTNVNQVYGNFAIQDNEMFMVLNRRYEPAQAGTVFNFKDLTTYIDPVKFNHIFAETSLDAQNFWMQIAVDITARRKMSAKVMPNL